MGLKSLCDFALPPLLQALHPLEKCRERLRIIASLVHVFHAQEICLGLESAREFKEGHRQPKSSRFIAPVADRSANHHQGNRSQVHQPSTGALARDMTSRNM